MTTQDPGSQPEQNLPSDQSQNQGGPLGDLRRQAQQRSDDLIDQNAQRIPGAQGHTQQAKDMASKGMDRAQEEVEKRKGGLGDALGGILGKKQEEPPQQQP